MDRSDIRVGVRLPDEQASGDRPRVTAVVVSYNSCSYLRLTLQALRAQRGVELQVVVVDNASADTSVDMVRSEFPEVELVASSKNQGLAGGANRGIEVARHPLVCTMNEDLELEPDALSIMAAYMGAHPRAGAVGPQLRNSDGSLQHSGLPLPTAGDVIRARYHLGHPFDGQEGRDFDQDCSVGVVPGACIMVTRRVLTQVGGYDEQNFFVNWEDIDWCRRIASAGYEVRYVPRARATHHLGVSTATNSAMVSLTGRSGAIRYFRKHRGPLVARLLAVALLPGDVLSLLAQLSIAVLSRGKRGRVRLARSILAVTWSRGPAAPSPARSRRRRLKRLGKAGVQGLLRVPGMLRLAEAVTRQLGRRWPGAEIAVAPRFQIVDSVVSRGMSTTRLVHLPGGVKLNIDMADYWGRRLYFSLSSDLERGWIYEPQTTRFVWRWLRRGDTFIDIGANVGYFAVMAASIVGPSGRVHAFEPNPSVSGLLKSSAELNGFQDRLVIEPVAVTSKTGSIRLWRRPDLRASDDATTVRTPGRIAVPVGATTLDDYCSTNGVRDVRLIKIDVEGAELEVLKGAANTLATVKPAAVICEFAPVLLANPRRWWERLIAVFSTFGYSVYELDDFGLPMARGREVPSWDWGNVCFLADGRSALLPA